MSEIEESDERYTFADLQQMMNEYDSEAPDLWDSNTNPIPAQTW